MKFALRITFNGNCAEAVAFYSDVFCTAPEEIVTFGEKRDVLGDVPDAKKRFIYNAVIDIPGTPGLRLFLGDTPALLFQDDPGGFYTQHVIEVTDTEPDVIRKLYDRFMLKGKTNKVLTETPPYKLAGSLIDCFGICWELYCV